MTARALTLPRWWTRANKTEQAYYVHHLGPFLGTKYSRIDFEPETLLLGEDCRYTPDFRVIPQDGVVEFHEVKGPHAREDAVVKYRTAPLLHPYRFFLAQLNERGEWSVREWGA
jgi:hypothetical protein